MTSVLAPPGVGLWGAPLYDRTAAGSYERLPSEAYNLTSIGQRGGNTRVPLARVTALGIGPEPRNDPGDPFNKQAATFVVKTSAYPLRTLRDGLIGGGRDAGAIRVPIARVTPTAAEVKTRIAQEAKSERPTSTIPVTLDQAIALLKAAEEGWTGSEEGYNALVADAQRLKAIKAVVRRRPVRDDEQAIVNQIADRYSGAVETEVRESARRQQAIEAKQSEGPAAAAEVDQMRADLAARFAPHARAARATAQQQADAIAAVLGPKLNRIAEMRGDPDDPASMATLGDIRDAIRGMQGGDPRAPVTLSALARGGEMMRSMNDNLTRIGSESLADIQDLTRIGSESFMAIQSLRRDLTEQRVQKRERGKYVKGTKPLVTPPSASTRRRSASPGPSPAYPTVEDALAPDFQTTTTTTKTKTRGRARSRGSSLPPASIRLANVLTNDEFAAVLADALGEAPDDRGAP